MVGFKSCFAYRVTSGDSGFALDGVDMDSESAFEQQLVQSGKSPKGGEKKPFAQSHPTKLNTMTQCIRLIINEDISKS